MKETGNKTESKRWWDFYLIRYLMGTVVGVITFHLILFKYNQESKILGKGYHDIINHILALDSWYSLVFLMVGGMIFSYFSSSPILILHTLRLVLHKPKSVKRTIKLSAFQIVLLFVFAALTVFISAILFKIHFGIMIIAIVLLIPIGALIYYWSSDKSLQDENEQYRLQNLAYNMANKRKTDDEFVETYRHLREHGNAFFIVFLEIILGLCLYQARCPNDVLAILSVWIVPPVLIWFYANYLEYFLLPKKKSG